jgi:short-subunit dehydrogenase
MTTPETALITGASSGIGYELTKRFASDGFDLVLVARDSERLEDVASEMRERHDATVTVLPTDLALPGAADKIAATLEAGGIEVDVLVNNAGFNVYGPFWQTDGERELAMLQVNIVALTRLTKLLLPAMVRRGSGRILNIGSTGSFAPGPFDAVYCASKAYVLSFSEAIAEELEGTGVTVTALCPGATRTRFAERAGMTDTPMFRGRVAEASDVAAAGYRALRDGRRVVVPGLANALLAFSVRLSPRRLVASIGRRMLVAEGGVA